MAAAVHSPARLDYFPRAGHAETSRAAYESVRPFLSEMGARVYDWVVRRGDATMDEIEAASGMKHQTVGPLALDLRNRGLLIAKRDTTGKTVKRPTRSGRMALVYVAVPPSEAKPRPDARPNKYEVACRLALGYLDEGMPLSAASVLREVVTA